MSSRRKACPILFCASLPVDRHPSMSRVQWPHPSQPGKSDQTQDECSRLPTLFSVCSDPCNVWQLILRSHKPWRKKGFEKIRVGQIAVQRLLLYKSCPCDKRSNERGWRFVRTERFVANGMTDKCGEDGWVKADREQLAATIHWR